MPLKGSRRTEALSVRPARRRPWRFRLSVLVSVLIHVAIGVLLLVTVRRGRHEEQLPPPSAVTMVFESGRRTGPTLPNPTLQAAPPPAVPSPVVPVPSPPVPSPPVPSPPVPSPPVPPVAPAPQAPALPAPASPAPARPVTPPAIEARPPPPTPERSPIQPPSVKRPVAPRSPPPNSGPKPPRRAPSSGFSAPMDLSFGKPPLSRAQVRPRSLPHVPGTIDMSLGPAARGKADPTPYSDRDQGRAGADWRNALSRWVAEHAYYPEQARRNGDEGDAKVHVIAGPDGHVREVRLIGKSGSMWLDLALLSLFRDQHIPPFPDGGGQPIIFDFTMHYVLVRPRQAASASIRRRRGVARTGIAA